jgi:hypothetical protein
LAITGGLGVILERTAEPFPAQLHAQLVAYAAFLLAAPRPTQRFDPAGAARCLVVPALAGLVAGALLGQGTSWHVPAEPTFAQEHRVLLGSGNPVALLLAALLGAAVAAPALLVRRLDARLEFHLGAAALGGFVSILALDLDVLMAEGLRPLLAVLGFLPLAAGGYLADRWEARGASLRRSQDLTGPLGAPKRVLGACLAGGVALGVLVPTVGRAVQRPFLGPHQAPVVVEALNECEALLAEHRAARGAFPASLPELAGVPEELASGVIDGYVVRYACSGERWAIAADPTPRRGHGFVHYQLRSGGELEDAPSARPLRVD